MKQDSAAPHNCVGGLYAAQDAAKSHRLRTPSHGHEAKFGRKRVFFALGTHSNSFTLPESPAGGRFF
ncbi:hypothetical protein [Bosea sp. TAB14]|jgi:hypothetical protein|uniref:hypothetical protein n=1 Tax=Bosea sp. TAB14 TaxID=3237481 RepID=UPI003F92A6A9